MKKAMVPVLAILLVVIIGSAVYFLNSDSQSGADANPEAADAPGGEAATASECAVTEYAMGLRWQQGAEAQALQGQTYEFAAKALDDAVAQAPDGEDLAIMTDLDETAIDNSELLSRDLAQCHDYSTWDTWGDWEQNGEPGLIPGALDFFSYADSLGVDIFYVSDRTEENKSDTLATLEALKLPQVGADNVLLLGPPKAERRAIVESDHTLVMQLGDTLQDFDGAFADASLDEQERLVEANADKFGTEWIVLPNPTYGNWAEADLEEWDAPLTTDK